MRKLLISMLTIASILVFIRCEKNNEGTNEITQEDISAIEGMEKSLFTADQYNDSIFTCLDSSLFCEDEYLNYCDSLFHHYANEYEHHHGLYSHLNEGDDHHHESMGQNHHGNGMMGGQNQGHSIQSMNQMDSLLSYHNTFH